jgi:hypothetical protein
VSTFIPALAYTFARSPAEVEVAHEERAAGESKYSYYRLLRLNFDLVTGFSLVPLQLFSLFGIGVAVLSVLVYLVVMVERVLAGAPLAVRDGIQARARVRRDSDAESERLFDPAETAAQRTAMIEARRALARAHPAAYLAARWHEMYRVLGVSRAPREAVYTKFLDFAVHRYALGHVAIHARSQELLNRWARTIGRSWLSRPFVYLVLALVLLPFAVRGGQRELAMLLASGLAHEASLFVLAIAPEYRLSHWMILCTWLAAVAMLARRIAPRS